MAKRSSLGSLTKEPPLATLDATVRAITPGMRYDALLAYAAKNTLDVVPGLLAKRFLLLDSSNVIVYDRFLSLASTEGIQSPRVRKVMYLVWALRDERVRRFILERVADRDGKWKISALRSKANSKFLEEWLQPSSAKKARSNIEFFLQETGIYDPKGSGSIHLELDDDWLLEAMQVAAQHEPDPAKRAAMTSAPAEFLVSRRWHGLVNATLQELGSIVGLSLPEGEPLEDTTIELIPSKPGRGKRWAPTEPKAGRRRGGTFQMNYVAYERAGRAHQLLEALMAEAATGKGYEPLNNENIDLYFETPSGTVLAEMKSCHRNNVHSQIRRGVSQLLEYRFFYRDVLGKTVSSVLVIETPPPREKAWLVEFLGTVGVTLIWKEPGGTRLVTGATIPDSLRGLVSPA